MRRTGRRAHQRPSNGSLLGALFIAEGVGGASDAIAAMEPSFGCCVGASFFIWLRLARTSSSVTETLFTLCAGSVGFCTEGAAMAWRKSLLDMLVPCEGFRSVGCTRLRGGYASRAPLSAVGALVCAEVTRAVGRYAPV